MNGPVSWGQVRAHTPLTLDPAEIDRFRARYAEDLKILRQRYPEVLATF